MLFTLTKINNENGNLKGIKRRKFIKYFYKLRTKWNNLPLKHKLTILYTTLLAISLAIVGTVLLIYLNNFMINEMAVRIRAQAKPVIEHWLYSKNLNPPPLLKKDKKYAEFSEIAYKSTFKETTDSKIRSRLIHVARDFANDLSSKDTAALILLPEGKVIAEGRRLKGEFPPVKPDPHYYKRALSGENEVTYITEENDTEFLVVLIPLRENPESPNIVGIAQLSAPLTPIKNIISRQVLVTIIVTLIVLFAGVTAGLVITSSTLKDLKGMLKTCEIISHGNLSKRVNIKPRNDEIGQLAVRFNEMVEKLEKSFESQNRFIRNAAHELRTPITILKGSIEVLIRGVHKNPSEREKLLTGMHREAIRLTKLCEKLLDLSKLNVRSNINCEEVSIPAVIDYSAKQGRLLCSGNKRIFVRSGKDVLIWADKDALFEIILNLIENAVKFTDNSNGKILVGWTTRNKKFFIFVKDNGTGIPENEINKIFNPFYRGEAHVKAGHSGTGLGLAIAKAISDAHGWKLCVKSKAGRGSTFYIIGDILTK